MNDPDKPDFARTLELTMAAFQMPATREVVELWWQIMKPYTLAEFKAACQKYLATAEYPPRIASIAKLIAPPPPEPDQLVAMARNRSTPMGALAYTFLRDYIDQPWPTLKVRAMQFIDRWDEHQARIRTGPLTRQERHYLALYCQGQDVPALTQDRSAGRAIARQGANT